MKKIICIIITATLLLTSTSVSFAKSNNAGKQNNQKVTQQQQIKKAKATKQDTKITESTNVSKISNQPTTQQLNKKVKATKQEFKINGSPVIKYGKYKLPIKPVTKGMGATVAFEKETAVLTVVKGTNTIVIDFKNKIATVNGIVDTKSGIFTAKNDKKMTVLIKYIAKVLGVRANVDKDEVSVEVPGLDLPTNITITPVGTTVISNTLNSTTLYMTATANIIAAQATGGKAELYVGSKLVATDAVIAATDTTVTFTTSDETPINTELQAQIPAGGVVTIKLYNADNKSVTSTVANPTLIVDYAAPEVTAVTSAVYSVSGGAIQLNVTGTSAIGDTVDVTKVSIYDSVLNTTYQLTNAEGTGSKGVVSSENILLINLGSADRIALTSFHSSTLFLNIAVGSFVTDAAGNNSTGFTTIQTVPVTVRNE